MATESEGFAGEGFSVLVQVTSRLMQEHSWLGFEVSRVLIAQQNVPCLLLKGEKLVCCLMKSIRQQTNYSAFTRKHGTFCCAMNTRETLDSIYLCPCISPLAT